MIYQGKAITVKALESGIVELNFDLKGESVNKFNRLTLNELREAVDAIKADASVKGVIVTSGKGVFIVGADITEFVDNFKLPDEELLAGNLEANKIFSAFEDLEVPTVAAINGIALGGGLEMCLAADFRVMSATAKIGLPEVKLGIYPGFGGTVRLPRLIGMGHAMDLILTGRKVEAAEALQMGLANRVVPRGQAREAAIALARQLAAFPQATMRADRESAHAQWNLPLGEALQQEWQRGKARIPDALDGAQRFAAGEGRHGRF